MKLDPVQHGWMSAPATRAVMRALAGDEDRSRFVGGAVRNSFLGEAVGDVDIATQFTPDEVMRRLAGAGLRAVATGVEHGTVTAIAEGKPFEVTTLRRDVKTFGRRAVVAYTTDWKEDAVRRDFTINALYAAHDGTLFDYFGGLQDIAVRRVRFIGDARQRIREDYLRILRFFRFHAWYGRGDPDSAGMAACTEEKSGLKLLSGERVQKELLLLLQANSPAAVLRLMQASGILAEILQPDLRLARCEGVIAIEQANGLAPDPHLRLAALLPDSKSDAGEIAQKLRLSNEARDRMLAAAEKDARIIAGVSMELGRRLIYRAGPSRFIDQLLLQWGGSGAAPDDAQWRLLLALAKQWRPAELPVSGDDVMALGVPEGPRIGVLLREIEQWWMDRNFAPTRDELLEQLRRSVNTAGR